MYKVQHIIVLINDYLNQANMYRRSERLLSPQIVSSKIYGYPLLDVPRGVHAEGIRT